MPKWLVSLTLLIPLSACQLSPQGARNTEIVKGQQDPASYHYLQLDNGLKVLLLSDTALAKAYASLTVKAGYYQDPEQMPGLAHLYEHMLSKGSQKYPDAAEYKQFLADQGGRSNASTSAQATNYYFETAGDGFEPALDRFAWQFIGPLLPAELVYKERHAVNAEFSMKFQDAFRRKREVMRTLFNPEHGYRKFSTGNLHTLQDSENLTLHKAMTDFGQDYYCSSRMSLVLAGPQSLAALEQQAKDKFSAIADNCRKALISQPVPLLAGEPRQVDIKTLRKRQRLTLSFPMPSSQVGRDALVDEYSEWLLESFNPNGLENYLREQGWVQSLSASISYLDDKHELLSIEFVLTNSGKDQQSAITAATHAYFQMLREQALNPSVFKLFARLSATRFDNSPEHVGADEVRQLSRRLLEYPASQVLSQGYLSSGFNPSALAAYWAAIKPENMLVVREGRNLNTQSREPIYQTEYQRALIPDWTLAELVFTPPSVSPYFAEAETHTVANALQHQSLTGVDIWYQPPRRSADSYTAITLYIDSHSKGADFDALNALREKRLEQQLEPILEQASSADIQAGISATSTGMRLQIKGQSGNWSALFSDLLGGLEKQTLSDEAKKQTLVRRINALEGFERERLTVQSSRLLDHQLGLASLPNEDLLTLRDLQESDYNQFVAHYLDNARVTLVVYGPVPSATVDALGQRVLALQRSNQEQAKASTMWDGKWPTPLQTRMIEGTDSAVRLVLQPKAQTLDDIALVELLGSMLKAPFFHQLRTQEQLGYTVRAGAEQRRGIHYLGYFVQSPVASATQLHGRIARFNQDFLPSLQALTQMEFDALKANLLDALRQGRLNSADMEAELRTHIRYGRTLDWQEQLELAIQNLSLETFQREAASLLALPLNGLLLDATKAEASSAQDA